MQAEDYSYPQLPETGDDRWQLAAIRLRDLPYLELLTEPDYDAGAVLHYCYSGDMIGVVKRVRYGSWIAAKVGYKVGWLDVTHVNFTLTRALETRETPQIEPQSDWLDHFDESVPEELLTSEMEAINTETSEEVSSNDINRLVRYLKGLAFGRR